jgi:hypothetical protein
VPLSSLAITESSSRSDVIVPGRSRIPLPAPRRPGYSRRPAPGYRKSDKTRRLHELSIEVLTSYELAEIASIGEGYDIGLDRTPVSA